MPRRSSHPDAAGITSRQRRAESAANGGTTPCAIFIRGTVSVKLVAFVIATTLAACAGRTGRSIERSETPTAYLLIRSDDLGMSHAKNMANLMAIESGLPMSVSVMFACPWYQEAVEMLASHEDISIGVHLTLNAEWRNYRWGPVAGRTRVPSLVDSLGYFYPTRAALFAAQPRPAEVEIELRAQIERALATGLPITYIDHHMGAAVSTPELRALVERLADEYQLGIPQYFGERYLAGHYFAEVGAKEDSLIAMVQSIAPGSTNLMVFHLGLEVPEMNALVDMNAIGPKNMSSHRHAELQALLSKRFREALRDHNVELITYDDLIERDGLQSMRRPDGVTYVVQQ